MKKILILIIVFISLLGISSCKEELNYDDMDKVTYETMLNLSGSYIVVAYQANCPNCEKLKGVIAEYDDSAIIIREKEKTLMIYKHAISTIQF